MSLVILVPMLGRAHRVEPLLASIRATCTADVLFLLTPGDDQVLDAVATAGADMMLVDRESRGDYARKINRGIAATSAQRIFTGADDLNFHSDWYELAVEQMRPGIGVVGTNDICNRRTMRGDHATHMLVDRAYVLEHGTVDEPGKFFHEGYAHEYCDDEAVETAKRRGAFGFARRSIVEHLHPMAGKAPWDDLYSAQAERMRVGCQLYRQRRPLWR